MRPSRVASRLKLLGPGAHASPGIIVPLLLQLQNRAIPILVAHGAGAGPIVGAECKVAKIANQPFSCGPVAAPMITWLAAFALRSPKSPLRIAITAPIVRHENQKAAFARKISGAAKSGAKPRGLSFLPGLEQKTKRAPEIRRSHAHNIAVPPGTDYCGPTLAQAMALLSHSCCISKTVPFQFWLPSALVPVHVLAPKI
jgi:hypothetical protein